MLNAKQVLNIPDMTIVKIIPATLERSYHSLMTIVKIVLQYTTDTYVPLLVLHTSDFLYVFL